MKIPYFFHILKELLLKVLKLGFLHLKSPRLLGGKGDSVVARVRATETWVFSQPVLLVSKRRKPDAPRHIHHVVPTVSRVLADVIEVEVALLWRC